MKWKFDTLAALVQICSIGHKNPIIIIMLLNILTYSPHKVFDVSSITQVKTTNWNDDVKAQNHRSIISNVYFLWDSCYFVLLKIRWESFNITAMLTMYLGTSSSSIRAELSAVVFRLKEADWEIMRVIRLLLLLSVGSAQSCLMCGCEGWWSTGQ